MPPPENHSLRPGISRLGSPGAEVFSSKSLPLVKAARSPAAAHAHQSFAALAKIAAWAGTQGYRDTGAQGYRGTGTRGHRDTQPRPPTRPSPSQLGLQLEVVSQGVLVGAIDPVVGRGGAWVAGGRGAGGGG